MFLFENAPEIISDNLASPLLNQQAQTDHPTLKVNRAV